VRVRQRAVWHRRPTCSDAVGLAVRSAAAGLENLPPGGAVEKFLVEEVFEPVDELVAEDTTQDRDGQQEKRLASGNPTPMICRQAAGGNDTVDMWMEQQVRSTGVPRYHGHAKVCIQPTRGRVSSLFLRLARYIA
jgi:hypothetical protein